MATITKPMALDESFNTTESTSRNQADVLAGIEEAIRHGFGQVASAVEYDNTDSGLTADNVQDAIDEMDDTVDGLVDDVTEISNNIESTQTASGNPITLTDASETYAESLVVELAPQQDLHGQSAPYVGGAGKNKVDISETTISSSDYVFNLTNFNIPQGTYTFSFDCTEDGNASFACGDDNTDFVNDPILVRDGKGAITFTTTNTITQMRLYGYAATYSNFQLEVGSQATSFAPYSNICPITGYTECEVETANAETDPSETQSVSIQFGQTVYGGSVDVTNGGTDDEFENLDDFTDVVFNANQSGTYAYEVYITTPNKKNGVDNLIANEMPVKTLFTDVAEFSIRGYGNDSDISIKFPKSIVNNIELAKQWCIDNNLQIVYEKAPPTVIQTPPTDLKLLKGTNNITTNGTTINLGYQPDNVIGEAKEKPDKINFSEIVKYTISGNTADLIPLVIDGTAHNNIPIVTDITKYRMLCVELVLKPSTAITGVYFSATAFTDGIYLPSGISVPVYIPSENFYANVTINPDGNGGFKLSYIAINQSQSTPPDYYSIRVRAFNQY